jgi:hypothetical protein
VLFSLVFASQIPAAARSPYDLASLYPKPSTFKLPTFKPAPVSSRDENPLAATPLVPADCKCPLSQTLSLHILTNAPGVWGSTLPFLKSYLNSFCAQRMFPRKKPFCKPLIFYSLRTLPSSVSRNSFACHSYENCRVYTNSSHIETRSATSHHQSLSSSLGFQSSLLYLLSSLLPGAGGHPALGRP